jgi:hypothetical protein
MSYKVDPNRKPDSPLAKCAIWTSNCTFPRNTKKKPSEWTIIPHCIAGNPSAEAQAQAFQNPNRGASAHYIIDSKGTIVQNVPECCRAWTTGGDLNVNGLTGSMIDHEAITMEIANISREPDWAMSAEAVSSLVWLCVDICQRNGIPSLKWKNDKFLAGTSEQNVAVHRWFARKSCPGNFLYNNMDNVVNTVNYILLGPTSNSLYSINGFDYSPVFDPKFYADKYEDLRVAFGDNDAMLWKHFCDFGMNEFRQASAEFNPTVYKERYSDLREAFGDDEYLYYKHYVMFGKDEGRIAN